MFWRIKGIKLGFLILYPFHKEKFCQKKRQKRLANKVKILLKGLPHEMDLAFDDMYG
jgi:hypothetical protein